MGEGKNTEKLATGMTQEGFSDGEPSVTMDQKPAVVPGAPKAKNVIFVGRDSNGNKRDAPTAIHGVTKFLDLPDPEVQVKGFYYERANELIRAFPKSYKSFIEKGG